MPMTKIAWRHFVRSVFCDRDGRYAYLRTAMAPVYRRSRPPPIQTENLSFEDNDESSRKRSILPGSQAFAALLCLVVIVVFASQHAPSNNKSYSLGYQTASQVNENMYDLAPGISLGLMLARRDNAVISGPHSVKVSFRHGNDCQPRVWARLVGDALTVIPMKPMDSQKWVGDFWFPVGGSYRIQVAWTNCRGSSENFTLPEVLTIAGNPTDTLSTVHKSNSTETKGLWLSSSRFNTGGETTHVQPYIWHNPQVQASDATLIEAFTSGGRSLVSKQGTLIPKEFTDLSNYELVCFVGSDSAADIRDAFLSLRRDLFPNQRPFKFHYYNVTSFEKPDYHWDEATKKRFRKCKTILVSVDELDEAPLTQAEYKRRVKTFLSHIAKAIPDSTFPIWMIMVNESPMTASTMCVAPRWSENHPCNDALNELWREESFPPRVKLLDTRDLVGPQFGENRNDRIALIAMQVYALVGQQVAAWRQAKQVGRVDGLHRNGVVEPNPKEDPYDWTRMIQ